jgi:hypothetical protein
MQLEEFLHPSEQMRATAQIDYDKGARVLFGVTNARCFVFEDTKREQSFTSAKAFDSLKIARPKMSTLLLVLGIILLVAYGAGLIILLIAWLKSKKMYITASVGSIKLEFTTKKIGQIHNLIQFMQFVHC